MTVDLESRAICENMNSRTQKHREVRRGWAPLTIQARISHLGLVLCEPGKSGYLHTAHPRVVTLQEAQYKVTIPALGFNIEAVSQRRIGAHGDRVFAGYVAISVGNVCAHDPTLHWMGY